MQYYQAVGKYCAVDLNSLKLPILPYEILLILSKKGFKVVDVNIISLARQCIGVSQYHRGARMYQAPEIVDCSSFIKWLYAQRGIWLPRRSIQQRKLGKPVNFGKFIAGDVVFISGYINYYDNNASDGVGHVGIATGEGTIIHAANSKFNVVESPVDEFVGNSFRGARRYIPKDAKVITLETPTNREVEISDDLRWIVLQSCPATQ